MTKTEEREALAGVPDVIPVAEVIANLISSARAAADGEVIIAASDLLRLAEYLRRSSQPVRESLPEITPAIVEAQATICQYVGIPEDMGARLIGVLRLLSPVFQDSPGEQKAIAWLDSEVQKLRGPITIGITEDGNIGVWGCTKDRPEDPCDGSGDTVLEAILAAVPQETNHE